MKSFFTKFLILSFLFTGNTFSALANDYDKAEKLLRKAKTATIEEEGYEYIHKARKIYSDLLNQNHSDKTALIGLSKVYQMIEDRQEAKIYVLKAYNMDPNDPILQREMADFFFNFQEYSTAIEYYKLALASGLLKDLRTNLSTAKCYEKLGDLENAKLYYQICNHIDSSSKRVKEKINEYVQENTQDVHELENAKYKYLFKDKPVSEKQKTDNDAEDLIKKINNNF